MLVFRLNKINLLATFALENPYLVCIWLFVFSIAHAKAATLEALINDAVETHPTVRAQMASASAADLGIEIARWQFYPTPSITAEGLKTSAKDPIYQGDDHSISLSIEQPLWTGGRLTASLDQANAEGESWSANPSDKASDHHLVINWQNNEFGHSAEADSSSYPVIFQVV